MNNTNEITSTSRSVKVSKRQSNGRFRLLTVNSSLLTVFAVLLCLLFGGKQRFNTAEGEFTQPSRGRKWGDLELAVRYDYLNLNNKDIYGGAGENFTIGLNYYVNNSVKIVLNYQ